MRCAILLVSLLPFSCFGQWAASYGDQAFLAASLGAGSSFTFTETATKFVSGTPDYLSHSGDFSGVSASKLLTVSFWFKLNDAAQNTTHRQFFRDGGDLVAMWWEGSAEFIANNDFAFISQDSGFGNALRFATAATFTQSSSWHHIMFCVDMSDNTKRFVYVDGSADSTTWVTYNNVALYWNNGGDIGMAATATGSSPTSVSLSEVWIGVGQYLDLSVSGNRAKFTSGGHPVSLGASGELPTGTSPTVYLHNSSSTFQNNLGTGGNFTVHGSPSNDASTP